MANLNGSQVTNLRPWKILPADYKKHFAKVAALVPELVSILQIHGSKALADVKCFVAQLENGTVIGAGALRRVPHSPWGQVALKVDARVAEKYRITVGRDLLNKLIFCARLQKLDEIVPSGTLNEDDPNVDLWLQLGFQKNPNLNPMIIYDADIGALSERSKRVYDKLLSRKKIPPQAHVENLADVPTEPVLELRLQELETDPHWLRARIEGRLIEGENYDHELSKILLYGDEVIGVALICRKTKTGILYDSAVIKEGWRNSWANALLKYKVFSHLHEAGFTSCYSVALPCYPDPHGLARSVDAKIFKRYAKLNIKLN